MADVNAQGDGLGPARTLLEPMLALGLCLACAVLLRLPALGMPLERDEGVYAAIGRALPGSLPYRDLVDHKQPVVYPVYWLLDVIAPRSDTIVHVASAVAGGLAAERDHDEEGAGDGEQVLRVEPEALDVARGAQHERERGGDRGPRPADPRPQAQEQEPRREPSRYRRRDVDDRVAARRDDVEEPVDGIDHWLLVVHEVAVGE